MDNSAILKDYIRKLKADGMQEKTLSTARYTLNRFFNWYGERRIKDVCKDDVYDYIDFLDSKEYTESTKHREKSVLKKFLAFVNPEISEIIKLKQIKNDKLPEEILTFEEIEKLINVCLSNRDRALIATFYESGARRGEMLSCQIKHASFDENGAVITIPRGKTGSRRVRLVYAASFLREWLTCHPLKEDRNAALFCSLMSPYGVISGTGLREQLIHLAERAKIASDRVYPHAFRHARATHLAEHFTEAQMKEFLGWTRDSKMASTYVHLSGRDIDNAVLDMYGIQPLEKKKDPAKVGRCPRCKELNPETSVFCGKCGLPLTQEAVTTVESIKTDYMQLSDLDEIREMKNVLKQELEEISKLKEMMLKAGK